METVESIIVSTINTLDLQIKDFSHDFVAKTIPFNSLTKNEANLLYERTLSSFINNKLYDYLDSIGSKPSLFVNEFNISFKNGITLTDFNEMRDSLSINDERKKMWKYCAVDGYFYFENNPLINHLFVEYKLNHDYSKIELAVDYLKFKCITKHSETKCWFAFVNCYKRLDYPTIIIDKTKPFTYIDSSLTTSNLDEYRVYVYKPSDNEKYKDNPEIITKKVNDLSCLMEEITILKADSSLYNNDDFVFLDSLELFNKRLIKSEIIRKNFDYLNRVHDALEHNLVYLNTQKEFLNNDGNYKVDSIIKEGSHYEKALINEFSTRKRIEALENNSVRGSFYASLNILIIIDYFLDCVGVERDFQPIYDSYIVGKGKHKSSIDSKKIIESQKAIIESHFNDDPYKIDKLSKYSFCLLYFLLKVLPLIYRKNGNKLLPGFSASYLIYEKQRESLGLIKKIGRALHIEKVPKTFSEEEIQEYLEEMTVAIFNKY